VKFAKPDEELLKKPVSFGQNSTTVKNVNVQIQKVKALEWEPILNNKASMKCG
jgi:hypothetical protein